jgi:peptidoglycan/LPS O-acetylase OafA/YrhL
VSFVDRRPAVVWAIAVAAFGAFVLIAGGENGGVHSYTAWEWMAHQVLYAVAATAFVSVAVFGDQTRGAVRRVLAFRPLLYLGMVSYGVYLWHFFLLRKLSDWGLGGHEVGSTYLTWFVVGSAFSVLVASVSYYVVERPALSLKRLVPSSREARPRDAVAEPAPAVPATVGPSSE